ncbi:MAG: hypothetical protein J6Y19_03935, partial [Kiritimatiellae bacterium]|nr:hypothetical protein [Kiritimatiellia bacterium]
MTTLDMEKPDINILANLYKARRKAFGFNDVLLRNVEWCVCAGAVAVGRGDLYYKSLKNGYES